MNLSETGAPLVMNALAHENSLSLIGRGVAHGSRTAIADFQGEFTYSDLMRASAGVASALLDGHADLNGARVAFLTPSCFDYVATQWGIWRSGGVAVSLCVSHPRPELEYVVSDSGAKTLIAHQEFETVLRPIAEERGIPLLLTSHAMDFREVSLPCVEVSRRAMIVYTSGTTSKPKGVVTTHRNIQAQVESLVGAWEWAPDDAILNILPLHHVHGIINVVTCALWSGARCEMMPRFDAQAVWDRIIRGGLTLFMAVPTIYSKLIAAWEAAPRQRQIEIKDACSHLRLMVSGSTALPVSILEKWKSITGHTLLERYGMTETGMILSNPLHGERVPGCVGIPLPGVEVRLVDERGALVKQDEPGEIHVRGSGVFLEYHNRTQETAKAFRDAWFCTGDIALLHAGVYRILGRSSVDIIKSGGYKISALEVEEVLRSHPRIAECAVVGVEDSEWGERICAAVVEKGGNITLDGVREWLKERLAPYKVPTRLLIVDELPRNAMGKVIKPEVVSLFV